MCFLTRKALFACWKHAPNLVFHKENHEDGPKPYFSQGNCKQGARTLFFHREINETLPYLTPTLHKTIEFHSRLKLAIQEIIKRYKQKYQKAEKLGCVPSFCICFLFSIFLNVFNKSLILFFDDLDTTLPHLFPYEKIGSGPPVGNSPTKKQGLGQSSIFSL